METPNKDSGTGGGAGPYAESDLYDLEEGIEALERAVRKERRTS